MMGGILGKIKIKIKSNWFLYQFIFRVKKKPIFGFLNFIIMIVYSYYISFRLFGVSIKPRCFFSQRIFPVYIEKGKKSSVSFNSEIVIVFESFANANNCAAITLSNNAHIYIENTFVIGNGCHISVFEDASLNIKGRGDQPSGITCDTKVICTKEINIGKGTIISWGGYITDSSHHAVNGIIVTGVVNIGDSVWISEGVSIGPGTTIGKGSIVGCKSYLKGCYPENSLIAGCPAAIKKENILWMR